MLPALAWMLQPAPTPSTRELVQETPLVRVAPASPAASTAQPAPSMPESGTNDGSDGSSEAPAIEAVAASEAAPPGNRDDSAGEQTLFLTIIGDKVYRMMGPANGRPPRIDQLTAASAQPVRSAPENRARIDVRPGAGYVIADYEQPAVALGLGERPLGPAPQECPRTLPAGSTQATADGLKRQAGCRYLSSCAVDSGECTFFYQGRG